VQGRLDPARAALAGARDTRSKNYLLLTPEDRLLCMLNYLKQYPAPLPYGRLSGMRQYRWTSSCR